MINDFKKEDQFSSIFEEKPLIRNISLEMDRGKRYFLDNKGNNYICNIYGDAKPKFRYNISGFIDGKKRKYMVNSRSLSDILISNRYKLSNNSDDKSYLPSLNKFEGYVQFPRPICPPFVNIPSYILNKKHKKTLKDELSKSFENEENKSYMKKEEENKGISYITANVKNTFNNMENNKTFDNSDSAINLNKDKKCLINLINDTCNKCKNQSINSLKDIMENLRTERALKHFKINLLNNDETSLINGRKLKEASKYVINEYKIMNNKLFKNYKSTNNLMNEHKNLVKCFSKFNLQSNQIMNNNKSDDMKIVGGRKVLKKLSINNLSKKANNLKEKILVPQEIKSIAKINLNNIVEKNLTKISRNKANSESFEKSSFNSNNNNLPNLRYMLDDQETKETLTSKYQSKMPLIKSSNVENQKNENLSYLSDYNDILNFRKTIKFLKYIERRSASEKKLLEGFKKEEPKKIKKFGHKDDDQPKYKDFGEIYKKELETLEKCNPILFELQKKINEKDMEKMKRRKEFKKLTEKMRLKGRTTKVKKPLKGK